MASEIRVDKINSLSGVGTVTLSPTGVDIAGITTAATLRATTGIVTSLTAGSLTSLGAVSGTTGTFSGAVSGTTGTFSGDLDVAEDIRHIGDTDTRLRFETDTITARTAGSERLRITSGGQTLFTGVSGTTPLDIKTSNSNNNTVQPIIESYADNSTYKTQIGLVREGSSGALGWAFLTNAVGSPTERFRITSDGKIGIGDNSPDSLLHIGNGTNADDGAVTITIGGNTVNARQSTIIKNNAGGSDRALEFHATTASSNHETIKFFSDTGSSQIVNINQHGLTFGTDSAAANALDDYEEGTWTISVTPGGGSFGVSHMNARYTKIGNIVTVQGWWRASSISGVSGSLTVSGLPYASLDYSSGGGIRQNLNLLVSHVSFANLAFTAFRIGNNSTQGSIIANTTGASGGVTTWTAGNIQVASELYISGSYLTAT